jgi:hypothetical protein
MLTTGVLPFTHRFPIHQPVYRIQTGWNSSFRFSSFPISREVKPENPQGQLAAEILTLSQFEIMAQG